MTTIEGLIRLIPEFLISLGLFIFGVAYVITLVKNAAKEVVDHYFSKKKQHIDEMIKASGTTSLDHLKHLN